MVARTTMTAAFVGLSLCLSTTGTARAQIMNGSFETGNFSDWLTADTGVGSWLAVPEGFLLLSGALAPTPPDGQFQAITDMPFPGAHVLYQEFRVPDGGVLEFDMWWDNQAEVWFNNGTLDEVGSDNQHARVDLMVAGTDPFSTAGGDTLMNIVTLDSGAFQGGYDHIVADISAFAGQTVRLRFAEVDNQFFFHFAIDNVFVPAPSALALLGLGGVFGFRNRARRRR